MTLADIASNMGIKEKHVKPVVEMFKAETQDLIGELESEIANRDLEGIARTAHSIKGSSVNLRLNDIAEPAKSLETAAKEFNTSFDYDGAFATLSAAFEEIKKIDS